MQTRVGKPARVLRFAAGAIEPIGQIKACPLLAVAELRHMTRILSAFLSFARLIGRVHMGSDLQRFIVATSYLMYVFTNYSAE